jgi:hypothetical protein
VLNRLESNTEPGITSTFVEMKKIEKELKRKRRSYGQAGNARKAGNQETSQTTSGQW